jgi:hypothetical protein
VQIFGGRAAELEAWLTYHILIVAILSCGVLALIAAGIESLKNQREAPHVAGTAVKVIGSTLSILTAFRLLLPFVVRGCWGTGDAGLPAVPSCSAMVTCAQLEAFGSAFAKATVPASTGLGTATLGALLASIFFFCATWKPVLAGRRGGSVMARIGRNIKKGLEKKKWDHTKAAAQCGLTPKLLDDIQTGSADPTIGELMSIADKLDRDVSDLLKQ